MTERITTGTTTNSRFPHFIIVLLFSALFSITFSDLHGPCATAAELPRPSARAIPIELKGVDNLHKIHDGLYRSAQPTEEGMKNLEKLGVKTIINLRAFHSDSDKTKGTILHNDELSVKAWHIEDEDVIRVLRILNKKEDGPFLVHCQHGADRTGVMSAMYRIIVQGWSKEEAIREMVAGGYGFHSFWSNIVQYVRDVNIERIEEELKK
jgi:protein tyrosine/serine phosphatase